MQETTYEVECSYVTVHISPHNYKIHQMRAGPARFPSSPIVVFIHGLGTNCLGFVAVMRLLAVAGIPSVGHDRLGLGRSSSVPSTDNEQETRDGTANIPTKSAVQLAQEVHASLMAAEIPPPYVLVGHSYGGVISRELLYQHADGILGMVLLDANTEEAADRGFDLAKFGEFLASPNVDYFEHTGLNAAHKLRDQEWAEVTGRCGPPEGFEKGKGGEIAEQQGHVASCRSLSRLNQYHTHPLGRKPVSVVKGNVADEIGRVLDIAETNGAGPGHIRKTLNDMRPWFNDNEVRLQTAQLDLAEQGAGRMVELREAGHSPHFTHPELVAREIQWVIEQITSQGIIEQWQSSLKR